MRAGFKPLIYRGEEIVCDWKPLFAEPRYCGGSAPSPPDPNVAAIQGIQQTTADYPYSYLVNALAQTGGQGTLINPATGQPQNYDFTGLGTADVQNTVSNQMAGVLLAIQQGLGSQYIAQRLADLKQSDPTGYAAYGQLFDQIQQEASQNPPDLPLSQATQQSVNSILQGSTSLTPDELQQVQESANASNAATGVTLGNAPAQAVGTAAVNALDQQQNQAEAAASQYLNEGVSPSDITYRTIEQNMRNLGAFINGQNPTAEFSSLSGAASGAAPNPNTGYVPPTMNEQQAAQQGINLANQGFAYQNELYQGTANPYLAGLNLGLQGVNTIANSGYFNASPYSSVAPQANQQGVLNEYYGINAFNPGLSGSAPATTGVDAGPVDTSGYA